VRALSIVLSLALIFSIIALSISPQIWWGFAFIGAGAPLLWVLNFLTLLYWVIKPGWWSIVPLIGLLVGLGVFYNTFAFTASSQPEQACMEVLSYNLNHFGRPKYYLWPKDSSKLEDPAESATFMDWVVKHPARVKSFQEFFSFPGDPIFDAHMQLSEQGWKHAVFSVDTLKVNKAVYGLAIYSKYPILASGMVFKGSKSFNKGIWADLDLGQGDTLRLINVHFESAQLQNTKRRSEGKKETMRNMLWVMRESLLHHADQVEQVLYIARQSPYPVIISGDFNSTPYSYTYIQLEKEFQNAFAEKGRGFGFTFNHDKLFFLRIDHQFASHSLKVCNFTTRNDVSYSDHFPLEASYQLIRNSNVK
jgi:endonuclease/exonuclease/phosphatase family metal-dependent hydrolase